MRFIHLLFVVGIVPLSSSLACSSGGGGGGNGGGGGTSGGGKYASQRSAKCLQWQGAMCGFLSDKCQFQPRPDCDKLYTSLFCEDDATLDPCLGALASDACPASPDLPASCKGLNDPAPVADFCTDFGNAICDGEVRCEGGDKNACLQSINAEISSTCANAVGITPTADQCLKELASLSCDATEVPASCKGVIITLDPTTGGGSSTQSLVEAAPRSWQWLAQGAYSAVPSGSFAR